MVSITPLTSTEQIYFIFNSPPTSMEVLIRFKHRSQGYSRNFDHPQEVGFSDFLSPTCRHQIVIFKFFVYNYQYYDFFYMLYILEENVRDLRRKLSFKSNKVGNPCSKQESSLILGVKINLLLKQLQLFSLKLLE